MFKICERCRKKFLAKRPENKFCSESCYTKNRSGKKVSAQLKEKIKLSLLRTYRFKRLGIQKDQMIEELTDKLDHNTFLHEEANNTKGDVMNLINKKDLNLIIKIKELKDQGQNSKQVAETLNISLVRTNRLWVKCSLL